MSQETNLKSVAAIVGRHTTSVDSTDTKFTDPSITLKLESPDLSVKQTVEYAEDLQTVLKALGAVGVSLSVNLPNDDYHKAQIILRADVSSKDALHQMARAFRETLAGGPTN